MKKRMIKSMLYALVTLIVSSTFLLPCPAQNQPAKRAQRTQSELVSKYKKNTLFDVSPDGNLLLLYGASTPKKDVKLSGVTEWQHKRSEEYFDLLRVVEWASGRELGNIHVHVVPSAARFTDGTKKICYREENKNKLWDYMSGQESACAVEPKPGAYRGSGQKYESPDGKFVAETSKELVQEILFLTYVRGVVTIADHSTGEKLGRVLHPTVQEPYDWPLTGYIYSVAFTPDNQHLITSYENDTYIWRINPPNMK